MVTRRKDRNKLKISAMENEPRNLTIGTLIRVAHALDSRGEIKLVRRKGTKAGRGPNGGGYVKNHMPKGTGAVQRIGILRGNGGTVSQTTATGSGPVSGRPQR